MIDENLKEILIENSIDYIKNVLITINSLLPEIKYYFNYKDDIDKKLKEIRDHSYEIYKLVNDINKFLKTYKRGDNNDWWIKYFNW